MPSLVLKPTHKPVKQYYAALEQLAAQGATHEGAVKTALQGLLEACASRRQWTLLGEYEIRRPGQRRLRLLVGLAAPTAVRAQKRLVSSFERSE